LASLNRNIANLEFTRYRRRPELRQLLRRGYLALPSVRKAEKLPDGAAVVRGAKLIVGPFAAPIDENGQSGGKQQGNRAIHRLTLGAALNRSIHFNRIGWSAASIHRGKNLENG